jgi:UDP-N-acetylglucosamine/UDP-N-acetylgalactosamine diphosphorylase
VQVGLRGYFLITDFNFLFKLFNKIINSNFAIWEVLREEEFSPLKNGEDAKSDNPTTCRNDLMEQHLKWLKKAGASLIKDDFSVK